MKVAKNWEIEEIPIEERPKLKIWLVENKVPQWPKQALWIAGAIWHCLWANPRLVRELGSGLRALEEHEWRPANQARNWNDI